MNRLIQEAKKAIDAIRRQKKPAGKVPEELEGVLEYVDLAIDNTQEHLGDDED